MPAYSLMFYINHRERDMWGLLKAPHVMSRLPILAASHFGSLVTPMSRLMSRSRFVSLVTLMSRLASR